MYIYALVFWVVAALMACWSFSLFVRLVSELFARRRTRLKSMRSNRSLWVGLVLIFICAGAAIGSGAMAIQIENQYTNSYDGWTTPITIVSSSIILFGVFLVIWALVGDRARGRKRCPKCWYDMSGAVGFQCPECGRRVKHERGFGRSKRPRWAFVVAICMFIVSGYGFVINKQVTEHEEWLAAVPTWVLMTGWEWLPEEWILYDNSPYATTLDERLGINSQLNWNSPWISDRRIRRFGRMLCKGLETDQASRWDIRRLALIGATDEILIYKFFDDSEDGTEVDNEWIGPPIDPEKLLRASWIDLAEALVADPPTADQVDRIDFYNQNDSEPINFARIWLTDMQKLFEYDEKANEEDGENYWDQYREYEKQRLIEFLTISRRVLSDQQHLITNPRLVENVTSFDEYRQESSMYLLALAGATELAFPSLFDFIPSPETMMPEDRARYLGMMIFYYDFDEEKVTRIFDQLEGLLDSDDPRAKAHALAIFGDSTITINITDQTKNLQHKQLFETVIQVAVNNHTLMYPDQQGSDTFHEVGLKLVTGFDTDGEWAYPLLLAELLADPNAVPDLPNVDDPFGSTTNVQAWVENFAQLSDTVDADVKEWLINNLPVQLGTPYDDLIDQIAVGFLDDPDDDIRDMAEVKLTQRFAESLISH